ncbi:MAG: RNA methyltransferase [Chloroflexi bacterium]|nr:RNA methyltransferase [Chloroflexota bacterium]
MSLLIGVQCCLPLQVLRVDDLEIITSTANESVKYVRSLHRRRSRYQERVFIAEGLRTVEEALKAGVQPTVLFHTPALLDEPRARLILAQAEARGIQAKVVNESVMVHMSDTVAPSGILAVLPMREHAIPNPFAWGLVIDSVRDPGNLGTILRSALAAGVELVVTSKGTVDIYSPKVVRAAMGAHFRLNFLVNQDWQAIEHIVRGLCVLLAKPGEGTPYWEIDWRQPVALVIGGEAEGAGIEAEKLASGYVTIPMRAGVESLNTAVATGILLFEAARQRFSITPSL